MQIQPIMKGMLLNCIDIFRPNHWARSPESMDPTGFVIAPKLAEIIYKILKLQLACQSVECVYRNNKFTF